MNHITHLSAMLIFLLANASRAGLPLPDLSTKGGCVNCYIPTESALKIPNTAFIQQLMPSLIKTANLSGELQNAAPAAAPELKRIGFCTGPKGLTTCTVLEDPCMVVTAAHLFASNEQLDNNFVAATAGDEDRDFQFTELFNDDEDLLGLWQGKGPNRQVKKEAFQFFIDRDPKTGAIDPSKSFRAEKFVYVNAYCDVAIVKLKPVNGLCPGNVDNRGVFKLPTDDFATKVIKNSEDISRQKNEKKTSAIAFYGFPEASSTKNPHEKNVLHMGLIKQYQSRFLKDNTEENQSKCLLTEHQSTTGKGNSGSPYIFVESEKDPLKADRNQVLDNYDTIVGLHSGNKSGNYNSGYLFTPEFLARLRKAINSERTTTAQPKK